MTCKNLTSPMSITVAIKSQGVPLAIKTAAAVLHGKYKRKDWFIAYEGGHIWNMGEEKNCVMSSLKLSYQDLSPPLKQCFAYCSLYPKSCEIEKNELILYGWQKVTSKPQTVCSKWRIWAMNSLTLF